MLFVMGASAVMSQLDTDVWELNQGIVVIIILAEVLYFFFFFYYCCCYYYILASEGGGSLTDYTIDIRHQLTATQLRSHVLNTIVYYIHCVITRSYDTQTTIKGHHYLILLFVYLHRVIDTCLLLLFMIW